MIYMTVWSGGYEPPSYALFHTAKEAFACAKNWSEDMKEDEGDRIDVLELDHTGSLVKRLEKEDE